MKFLCVIPVRNEAPFLLEWIAHHQGAGVTSFLVFSNDCDDNTVEILSLLEKQGLVVHIPIQPEAGQSVQWSALKVAWKHPLRKVADWMIVLDIDEFVNIHTPEQSLLELVSMTPPDTDAIALPWRQFGNSGEQDFNDTLITETFKTSIPADSTFPISASFFKTLFRTAGPFNQLGVHRPKQKKGVSPKWVDGSGKPLPSFIADNQKRLSLRGHGVGRDLVEVNHYSVKSAENFMVKRARGLPNRSDKNIDLAYWVDRNFNTEQNTSIRKMSAKTAECLAALHAIPGMTTLHSNAVKWHKDKFEALMKIRSEQQLFSQILTAGDSAILSSKQAANILKMYQNSKSTGGK